MFYLPAWTLFSGSTNVKFCPESPKLKYKSQEWSRTVAKWRCKLRAQNRQAVQNLRTARPMKLDIRPTTRLWIWKSELFLFHWVPSWSFVNEQRWIHFLCCMVGWMFSGMFELCFGGLLLQLWEVLPHPRCGDGWKIPRGLSNFVTCKKRVSVPNRRTSQPSGTFGDFMNEKCQMRQALIRSINLQQDSLGWNGDKYISGVPMARPLAHTRTHEHMHRIQDVGSLGLIRRVGFSQVWYTAVSHRGWIRWKITLKRMCVGIGHQMEESRASMSTATDWWKRRLENVFTLISRLGLPLFLFLLWRVLLVQSSAKFHLIQFHTSGFVFSPFSCQMSRQIFDVYLRAHECRFRQVSASKSHFSWQPWCCEQ